MPEIVASLLTGADMPGLDPRQQVFLAGQHAESTDADNATATATATPHSSGSALAEGQLYLLGISADFSAAVSAIKAITVTYTPPGATVAITYVLRWDFSLGPAVIPFPGVLACARGTTATAALAASGTGGVTGTIHLFYFEN